MGKLAKRATILAAVAVYAFPIRRFMRRWGATDDELARGMPGDELLRDVSSEATLAIDVAAPPAAVWPWVAQVGDGRGRSSAAAALLRVMRVPGGASDDAVAPEVQVREGDRITAAWSELVVERCEPERALVLSRRGVGHAYTWALVLVPAEGGTRLLSRSRYRGSRVLHAISEPIVYPVVRRFLAGVKRRAERAGPARAGEGARSAGPDAAPPPADPTAARRA